MSNYDFPCDVCIVKPCCTTVCDNTIYFCYKAIDEYRELKYKSNLVQHLIKINHDIILGIIDAFKEKEDIMLAHKLPDRKIELFRFNRMGSLIERKILKTIPIKPDHTEFTVTKKLTSF